MATPMTPTEIQAQLKRWGINFEGYRDWSTHNRNSKGAWGPVNGLIIHHTGSDGADQRSYLYSGNADLPGPLCHFHIDKSGKLWLIGWGRANHAGGGDGAVLQHVIDEDYTGTLTPHYGQGDKGAVDGNVRFYGVEIGYSGTHEMAPAQYATLMKLCASVAEHHKWTEKSFIAHGEWSHYKWDPGYASGKMMNMPGVRADIKHFIEIGPKGAPTPVTTIDKPDATNDVYEKTWHTDRFVPPKGHETTENPTWHAESVLRFAAEQAEAANKAAEFAVAQARANGEMLTKLLKHFNIS